MPGTTGRRSQRRILEASLAASVLAGAPSFFIALRGEGVGGAVRYGVRATRAVGTLVPPRRPGLLAGALTHFAISGAAGQALGRMLPRRHSFLWGAILGTAMGLAGPGLVGRRVAAVAALPFGPQLADNIAFGLIFAVVADRPS